MVRIVTRAEWGARPPKARHLIDSLPTPRLWVHHAGDDRQGARAIREHQNWHMDGRGWLDIAYSFLIGDDGTIWEGRGVGVVGGHTAGDNSKSHAICVLGNFEAHPPTDAAVQALIDLARWGRDRGWWIPTLGGHRDAPGANTACPGRHLYALLPDIRAAVAGGPASPEEDIMASLQDLENVVRKVLNEGAAHGTTSWARTSALTLGTVQQIVNKVNGIAAALKALDVDEAEVARLVIEGIDPTAIADAIPDTVAQEVVELLAARLAG